MTKNQEQEMPSSSSPTTVTPSTTPSPFQPQHAWQTHYYNAASAPNLADLSKNPLLNRIGLEPIKRIAFISLSASFWGGVLGAAIGSRQSGMQYLAENAHRLPKNMEGWYFYHRRKNYRMILGGFKRGAHYAFKTGGLVALYEILEASADFYRGGADVFNSVAAGIASGGIFSLINKLPRQSTKHTLILGAGFGLVSGGVQDFSSFLKGMPLWYFPQSIKERSLALRIPIAKDDK